MAETGALVVCVPNFSEGRRTDVIDAICDALAGGGARLVYRQADPEHHRPRHDDRGFAGRGARERARRRRQGRRADRHDDAHRRPPSDGRGGRIPFVPLSRDLDGRGGRTGAAFAAELADALGIPVYLYDRAATSPERASLAEVRKGEFEGLREAVARGERLPDFGPHEIGQGRRDRASGRASRSSRSTST